VGRDATAEVTGLQLAVHEPADRIHELFCDQRPVLALQLMGVVRCDVGDGTQAGFQRLRCTSGGCLDERSATQQAGRRVLSHRFVELVGQRLDVALLRGNTQAHGRLALIFEPLEGEFEWQRRTVCHHGSRAQRVACPFALGGCDQGTLECGMATGLEQVHQRLAEQVAGITAPEELDPRWIHVDDDAFLHVRNGIGRACHEGAHLVAILVGGCKRAAQGMIEAGGVQFSRCYRLQSRVGMQRDDILCAHFDSLDQVCLGNRVAHHQRGHARREPCTLLQGGREFVAIDETEEQQLWRTRCEGIGEVCQVAHPGAMHRVAGVAQDAVDDFDGILLPRQDDDWDGADFGQNLDSPFARLQALPHCCCQFVAIITPGFAALT
jgi:hypothetical protein